MFVEMVDQRRIFKIGELLLAAVPQKQQQSGLLIAINDLERQAVDAKFDSAAIALEPVDKDGTAPGCVNNDRKRPADTTTADRLKQNLLRLIVSLAQ
jgi:hypothetical protein